MKTLDSPQGFFYFRSAPVRIPKYEKCSIGFQRCIPHQLFFNKLHHDYNFGKIFPATQTQFVGIIFLKLGY